MDLFRDVTMAAAAAVLGSAAAFIFFLRKVMTKTEHEGCDKIQNELWEQKLERAKTELKGDIKALKQGQEAQQKLLERMDQKLDAIRENGSRRV